MYFAWILQGWHTYLLIFEYTTPRLSSMRAFNILHPLNNPLGAGGACPCACSQQQKGLEMPLLRWVGK